MSKNKLFDDDSDDEVAFKTQNEYAKKYDTWREKEEIHKLEQKYGSKALDPNASLSSDSEDESDEPPEVSEEMETQFLKTLSLLKTKDPRIYDPSYNFFDDTKEKKNEKKIQNDEKPKSLTFADSDDDDDDSPNIFTIEKKAVVDVDASDKKNDNNSEKVSKEDKLKDYLKGKAGHIEDDIEKDLEPLKAFWSDPKLNEGEAFLRDYILNKRYLEEGSAVAVEDKLRDDVELEADEALVEEQGNFERAYNFRFEEPDQEYLKRYPRTMNSIRPKDDSRARKRAEIRTRKEEEKKKKMQEIARLRALKLKEVREKIARIKHVTGNEQLAFKDEDIEGDFDPEEHDKRMKAIFDEAYYEVADDQKPVFPELDEELEIENWENFEENELKQQNPDDDETAPHCEDEDFNMDADYDPKKARENLLEELKRNMGVKRRQRKRKTKLGQLLATVKPKFIPEHEKTYSEFMEEYYKMDCEDVIGGDLPTRFKYREVVPNDYGLSIEEILLADDKELTQWVPLKKIVKHRPTNVEKSEVKTYKQKAADLALKRKMLPSLFKDLPETPEVVVPVEDEKKKKRKKKKKDKQTESNTVTEEIEQSSGNEVELKSNLEEKSNKKKKKRKNTEEEDTEYKSNIEVFQKEQNKQFNNNKIHSAIGVKETTTESDNKKKETKSDLETFIKVQDDNTTKHAGKKKKKHNDFFVVETIGKSKPSQGTDVTSMQHNSDRQSIKHAGIEINGVNEIATKKKKRKNVPMHNKYLNTKQNNKYPAKNKNYNGKKTNTDFKIKFKSKDKHEKPTHPFSSLTDERLKAYGLNPKKYKNFLKYKQY